MSVASTTIPLGSPLFSNLPLHSLPSLSSLPSSLHPFSFQYYWSCVKICFHSKLSNCLFVALYSAYEQIIWCLYADSLHSVRHPSFPSRLKQPAKVYLLRSCFTRPVRAESGKKPQMVEYMPRMCKALSLIFGFSKCSYDDLWALADLNIPP